jgi:cysteinyl-tRNA synthetase
MNFTFEALEASKQALFRLKRFVFEECKNKGDHADQTYMEQFTKVMNDDIDTPKALALMWEVVKDATLTKEVKVGTLREMDAVLDIGLSDDPSLVTRELGIVSTAELPEEIQELIDARELARTVHNWDESDRLREALNFKGYIVEDTPQGQRICKA